MNLKLTAKIENGYSTDIKIWDQQINTDNIYFDELCILGLFGMILSLFGCDRQLLYMYITSNRNMLYYENEIKLNGLEVINKTIKIIDEYLKEFTEFNNKYNIVKYYYTIEIN